MKLTHNVILSSPEQEPIQYVLNADRVGIGRAADNQIQVDLEYISYVHCELIKDASGEAYRVRDRGSKNGIRVNGEVVDDLPLKDGDRILLSESVAAYYLILPENEEPELGVERGPEEAQTAASRYADLDDRVAMMKRKIEKMEAHYEKRQRQFDQLMKSTEELQAIIEARVSEAGGGAASDSSVRLMKDELSEKTRQISVVKKDLEDTHKHILETTAKVTLHAD